MATYSGEYLIALAETVSKPLKILTLGLTSNAAGTVSVNVAQAASVAVPIIRGRLSRVVVTPDSGGTQPTALYDMTILDGDGQDLLAGNGANLDNTNGDSLLLDPVVPFNSALRPQLTNAGSAKVTTVKMYYEKGD